MIKRLLYKQGVTSYVIDCSVSVNVKDKAKQYASGEKTSFIKFDSSFRLCLRSCKRFLQMCARMY